ncbi:hypothetical protein [Vibrio mediterranei]|uniref:hypothetical protein n=1 Tax=Vibrio mediterranei TaxID=689 RepID=UPI004069884F
MSKITYLLQQREFMTGSLLHLYSARSQANLNIKQANDIIVKKAKATIKDRHYNLIHGELKAIIKHSKKPGSLEAHIESILATNTQTLGVINDFNHIRIVMESLQRQHAVSSGFITPGTPFLADWVYTDKGLYEASFNEEGKQLTPLPLYSVQDSPADTKLRDVLNDYEFLDYSIEHAKGYTIAHVSRNQYLKA